jgi:hypothetical protein
VFENLTLVARRLLERLDSRESPTGLVSFLDVWIIVGDEIVSDRFILFP